MARRVCGGKQEPPPRAFAEDDPWSAPMARWWRMLDEHFPDRTSRPIVNKAADLLVDAICAERRRDRDYVSQKPLTSHADPL